jgi:hypothetical protein
MDSILSIFLTQPFMYLGFITLTFFWWKVSRRFFIFLFNFSENTLSLKKKSWQLIVFNYGIFGPLGLVSISGYLYVSLLFIKFLKL